MSQDDDLAKDYLASLNGGPLPTATERMRDFSPERIAIANVEDRLRELTAAVVASNGGKAHQITYSGRPETAIERALEVQREASYRALVRRVLPSAQVSADGP